jgi:hypothetical protein
MTTFKPITTPNCDSDRRERRIKLDMDKLKEPDCIRQYQNALEESLQINLDQDKEEEDENVDADKEIEWNRTKHSIIQTTTHII